MPGGPTDMPGGPTDGLDGQTDRRTITSHAAIHRDTPSRPVTGRHAAERHASVCRPDAAAPAGALTRRECHSRAENRPAVQYRARRVELLRRDERLRDGTETGRRDGTERRDGDAGETPDAAADFGELVAPAVDAPSCRRRTNGYRPIIAGRCGDGFLSTIFVYLFVHFLIGYLFRNCRYAYGAKK